MNIGDSLSSCLGQDKKNDRISRDLISIIDCLALAAVELSEAISFSPAVIGDGCDSGLNGGGDIQKPLDVAAQQIFEKHLFDSPASMLVSEELDDLLLLPGKSSLCVAIDPLDGSSNIETNMSIGSIFLIIEVNRLNSDNPLQAINTGKRLAAGFFVYGPQTTLAQCCNDGVNIFALDPGSSEFILQKHKVQIPDRKPEFAINSSNYRYWDSGIRHFVDDCITGLDGPLGADYNMRWNASLVAEAYRILTRGGVFLYPADSRPGYQNGRIRLLYEALPIAMVIEQASGKATDGFERILDKQVIGYHNRVPLIFGSPDSVDRVEDYLSSVPSNMAPSPLFTKRTLFRN